MEVRDIKFVERFDNRVKDWHSGKMLPVTADQKEICACCGRKIAKGSVTNYGKIGFDCRDFVKFAKNQPLNDSLLDPKNWKVWKPNKKMLEFVYEV